MAVVTGVVAPAVLASVEMSVQAVLASRELGLENLPLLALAALLLAVHDRVVKGHALADLALALADSLASLGLGRVLAVLARLLRQAVLAGLLGEERHVLDQVAGVALLRLLGHQVGAEVASLHVGILRPLLLERVRVLAGLAHGDARAVRSIAVLEREVIQGLVDRAARAGLSHRVDALCWIVILYVCVCVCLCVNLLIWTRD